MARILILYSTTDGHTIKICGVIKQVLEGAAHEVTLTDIADADRVDPTAYEKLLIGASIRYGKHSPRVYDFVKRHRQVLERMPSAFFTVNIVARKPLKNEPDTNPYMRKFLRLSGWQPKLLGVFAGKLNYPMYGAVDRMMIRFIMLITKGPTDPSTIVEFTDWKKVEAFGRALGDL